MSAAAQPVLPHTPSSRRQHDRDLPHRTQSTSVRSAATPSPRRSNSTSQAAPSAPSHSRVPSANLQNVAQRDFEQSNLARPSSSARHSESQDRPTNGYHPPRSESTRASSSQHTRTQSRYTDQPTPVPSVAAPSTGGDGRSTTAGPNMRRRTTIDAASGHWDLGKTIGAGSMGKVKLARNKETGEQVAVKIVPRHSNDAEHGTPAERERADRSKEIRTAREAAIVTLVDHPYICGMRDVVRTHYHWYMLFEYVNGGQMLDYIISHGKLKEKQARKFGRQIASALDYCHRNSIVHRDLKIENILISKNGDIKIIDFGLSNLFAPRTHLKTFCGSLYFAAPELLQARQYTGPEVDVWSFGIVLYVLVCGKVPFDDQSMPQLHAKIKRGNVDYPPWLTPECKGLIARMLNTNPQERATMYEIMNHPWMTKGYNGPPENYLPVRTPLSLPLDAAVIEKMTGFDFGPVDVITTQLTRIIESDDYQRAVRLYERRNAQQTPELERKRGVFDFYKRRNSISSRDTLNTPSSEAVQLGNDPLNAFHPLISIYYLAREKKEREARERNPGALSLPHDPAEKPLPLPDLPPPQAAYTNPQTYEMPGEKPTGGRSRPRARTHGEDEVQDAMQNLNMVNVNTAPSPTNPAILEPAETPQQLPPPQRKESTAAGILRRLSTRRSRDSPAERPARPDRSERPNHPPPALAVFAPSSPANAPDTPRKSFSIRRNRERDPTPTGYRQDPTTPGQRDGGASLYPPPPPSAASTGDGSSVERAKRSHGLGRSISMNSSDVRRRLTRRGISEGSSMRPPMTSGSHENRQQSTDPDGSSAGASLAQRDAASDVESSSRPETGSGAGGSGMLPGRTRSVGHYSAPRPTRRNSRRATRRPGDGPRTADVPEETDQDMLQDEEGQNTGGELSGSPSDFKPVYLKGIFSVTTTSSKPLPLIRKDIMRVLSQLGVEYTEVRGGFRCRHAPSIKAAQDDTSLQPPEALPTGGGHRRKISFTSATTGLKQPPLTPGGGGGRSRFPRDASYDNTEEEEDYSDDPAPTGSLHRSGTRGGGSGKARAAGETSTHVQSDLGGDMVLKFEIFVVKVPLINVHGIQFKKIDGGTWQYKEMAQRIVQELRL